MIEVTAKLSQGAYLAGEAVECTITLLNPSPPPNAKSQCNEQDDQTLAWTSVQIYCQCWTSQSKVKVPQTPSLSTEEQAMANSRTSFAPCRVEVTSSDGPTSSTSSTRPNSGSSGVQGAGSPRVVFSTKPVILFCDLRLLPGESKSFNYRETLPLCSPPSFRGLTVKYAYKLTIGTQRINSPIRLLRVPIRVLALQDFINSSMYTPEESNNTSSNPFLDTERESPLDSALQMLQSVTSQSNQKFYNVTNSRGHVVKFCMFKHAFKLGEDIVGSLDFSTSNVPCIQFAVTLQSWEEVTPECRKGEDQRPAINSFSKLHEVCLGLSQSHFVLPVPLHITPGFYTDLINHKWRLHFEFVTSTSDLSEMKPQEPDPEDMDGIQWQAPASINIETMIWDLPIKIYPNIPSYISQGLQMETSFKQKI